MSWEKSWAAPSAVPSICNVCLGCRGGKHCQGVRSLPDMLCAYARAWTVQEDPSITRDVFLYCKAHLRSGAALPTPQQLTPIKIDGRRAATPSAACAAVAGWLNLLAL